MRVWSGWNCEGVVWVELWCGLGGVVRVWSGWSCEGVVWVEL